MLQGEARFPNVQGILEVGRRPQAEKMAETEGNWGVVRKFQSGNMLPFAILIINIFSNINWLFSEKEDPVKGRDCKKKREKHD